MRPIGPLMREHRLIEKMLNALASHMKDFKERGKVDVRVLDAAVDFFRTYADRTHHGKEEDILFRELALKNLSAEHKKVMDELIREHAWARQAVSRLHQAREVYQKQAGPIEEIVATVQQLTDFYPAHIEKEDRQFFYPCLGYFTREEQDAMLGRFWEFDRMLIHEKYARVIEEIKSMV